MRNTKRLKDACKDNTPKTGERVRTLRAAALLAAVFFIKSMTEIHMRHFAIIAIAIIVSVSIVMNYPLENLMNIIIMLSGIITIDKGIAVTKNKKSSVV